MLPNEVFLERSPDLIALGNQNRNTDNSHKLIGDLRNTTTLTDMFALLPPKALAVILAEISKDLCSEDRIHIATILLSNFSLQQLNTVFLNVSTTAVTPDSNKSTDTMHPAEPGFTVEKINTQLLLIECQLRVELLTCTVYFANYSEVLGRQLLDIFITLLEAKGEVVSLQPTFAVEKHHLAKK